MATRAAGERWEDIDGHIEEEVQRRGRKLLARVQSERLIALTPAWWQEQLMAWATQDPEFRVKLLRFVDVLPSLRTPASVADHVRQYFRDGAPLVVRAGSAVAGARPFRPVLSKVVREGVFTMADRFIGGTSEETVLPVLRGLNRDQTAYTVDLLGEAVLSDAEADVYLDRYLRLIAGLGGAAHGPDNGAIEQPNVSVKLTALAARFEPAAPSATSRTVRQRLSRVLELARSLDVFVNIDVEQYRLRDLTQVTFSEAALDERFRDWDGMGIVVQAYLRDADAQIEWLRALAERRGTPITVRLVKGAYWDEEVVLGRQEERRVPVFEEKAETDEMYERCTGLLVAAYPALRPAFGTHNPRSITQAIVKSGRRGLPASDIEFQMLYGMAEGLRRAVRQEGYRTRVYVPVGEILPGMAYLVRRLLENTSNESWLVHRHEEGRPEDLLRRPSVGELAPEEEEQRFRSAAPAEFYLADVRKRMETALAARRARFGQRYPLVIGSAERHTLEWDGVRLPADPDTVMGTVARASAEDAREAVTAACEALDGWRVTPASERAAVLRRAASLLEERRFEFAATMVFECAKPWAEADGDVTEAIDYLRYYATEAERLAAGIDLSVPGEHNRYTCEPRGVAAVIAPWNFPLAILGGMTTAALAAGCTVVMKPAEQSPIVAAELASVLREAGLPPGVLNYLPGQGETIGQQLVKDPRVDVIAFTGSRAVGLSIMEAAAHVARGQQNVKKVICEMGGKNAVIVDEDADLDQAVSGVITSAFGYAGQKCSACSRVIVVGTAYPAFRARLKSAVESLIAGPPEDPYTLVPPVISEEARRKVLEYVAIGEREGQLLARGREPGCGWSVAPVVFEGVPVGSRLSREEVFGPVLVLYEAASFEEALRMALDSDYALTGGLYSRNPRHIADATRRFRVGNLYINRKITGAVVNRQPFGGFAMSGAGDKAGGPDYVAQFMVPRVVTENTMRRGFAGE